MIYVKGDTRFENDNFDELSSLTPSFACDKSDKWNLRRFDNGFMNGEEWLSTPAVLVLYDPKNRDSYLSAQAVHARISKHRCGRFYFFTHKELKAARNIHLSLQHLSTYLTVISLLPYFNTVELNVIHHVKPKNVNPADLPVRTCESYVMMGSNFSYPEKVYEGFERDAVVQAIEADSIYNATTQFVEYIDEYVQYKQIVTFDAQDVPFEKVPSHQHSY